MELHPVRDLGERVVAGEVADAPLGTLTVGDVACDEYVALKLRVVAFDVRSGERHGNGLPRACPDDGLPSLLRGLREIEALAFALIEHGYDAPAEDLLLAEAEKLASGGVRQLDHSVG